MTLPPSQRHGADPIAFALLQWPALIGLVEWPQTWWGLIAKGALGIYWLALSSTAFRGSYAARMDFGFLILCLNLAFLATWLAYPHPGFAVWALLTLGLMLAGIGVARKLRNPGVGEP